MPGWKCCLCGVSGPGGVKEFYQHYLRDHG